MAIGDRIKLARRVARLNQRDLARAAGVSAMAISKYERGLNMPGSDVLLRLSKALGVRTEYFLRPVIVSLSVPHYRSHPDLPEKQKNSITAEVQEWLERYMEVEDLINESLPPPIPQINGRVETPEDVERVAEDLRGAWALGLDAIENLMETLEDKGIKVGLVNGDRDFDALTCTANGGVPVIAVKRGLPGDRQRFNLAHELAHLLLEPEEAVTEKMAHRFAGAFLVPRPTVLAELGEERQALSMAELYSLKHKYGLSMQAWVHRAKELGILLPAEADSLLAEFTQRGWKEREPEEQVPAEEPARMRRMVMRALSEDMISEPRAAELLAMPLAELRTLKAEGYVGVVADVRS